MFEDKEYIGTPIEDVDEDEFDAEIAESVRKPFIGHGADEETVNIELLVRRIELDGVPAVIGTVVDVDKDGEEYWELRRERDRLEKFTSLVPHDLRSPLTVAQGSLEFALSEGNDEFITDSIEEANWALKRMETMIDELLTLARQGDLVANPDPVALRDVAESA